MSIRVLSDDHIQCITDLFSVKDALSRLNKSNKLSFTTEIPISIKNVIKENIGLDLTNIKDVPMTWIVGDSHPHVDRGERHFVTTYLIYLTDSEGELIVDNKSFPIKKGFGLAFNEGLTHETRNGGIRPRLLIGPMSEYGFIVGNGGAFFYRTIDEARSASYGGIEWLYYTSNTENDNGDLLFRIPKGATEAYNNGSGDSNIFTLCNQWRLEKTTNSAISIFNQPAYSNDATILARAAAANDFINYFYNFGPENMTICFPSGTPIETDQGEIPIEKIDPTCHTISGSKIVALTENKNGENVVALLKKGIISENCPNRDTICSIWHKIEYGGKMIEAQTVPGAIALKYESDAKLFNILMEKHQTMRVNNMTVETLDPESPGAVFCALRR